MPRFARRLLARVLACRADQPRRVRPMRRLLHETYEPRTLCAIDVQVEAPVVSTFLSGALITGLGALRTAQPTVVHTIDASGVRSGVKELDGLIYAFQGNTVYRTDRITGATLSYTLRPLSSTTGVEIRDVGKQNDKIVFVGGSLTGSASVAIRSIPTMWDETGAPTRIGPENVTGQANFIRDDGAVGGYFVQSNGNFTPWLRLDGVEYALPASDTPTNEQMILASSATGQFLAGYETNQPMVWQTDDPSSPTRYQLAVSPTLQMEFPTGAVVDSTTVKRFRVVEDGLSVAYIFGQYALGSEQHASVWSISGSQSRDFGANTEMLGAVSLGGSFVVAHRNSISILNEDTVQTLTLNSLLPTAAPAGTTRRILDNGIFLIGSVDDLSLGINFAEVGTTTVNKIAIVPMKYPVLVKIDAEGDGTFEESFVDSDMRFPSFTSRTAYGQRTLIAQVVYSDASTESDSVTYDALPFESLTLGTTKELRFGGTTGNDLATLESLGAGSYRTTTGIRTRDFQTVDTVLVDMTDGNDTLQLRGDLTINLNNITNVEQIDMSDTTNQRLSGVDLSAVTSQVGPGGTLTITTDQLDSLEILGSWTVQAPVLTQGLVRARLTSSGTTLDVIGKNYTNPRNPLDVTNDGFVSARDALLGINYINQRAGGQSPTIDAYLDVNNNGTITALDVLLVINAINSAAGEGETRSSIEVQQLAVPTNHNFDVDTLPGERKRRSSAAVLIE